MKKQTKKVEKRNYLKIADAYVLKTNSVTKYLYKSTRHSSKILVAPKSYIHKKAKKIKIEQKMSKIELFNIFAKNSWRNGSTHFNRLPKLSKIRIESQNSVDCRNLKNNRKNFGAGYIRKKPRTWSKLWSYSASFFTPTRTPTQIVKNHQDDPLILIFQ